MILKEIWNHLVTIHLQSRIVPGAALKYYKEDQVHHGINHTMQRIYATNYKYRSQKISKTQCSNSDVCLQNVGNTLDVALCVACEA